jgi:uncharacterized membrane protein YfhO
MAVHRSLEFDLGTDVVLDGPAASPASPTAKAAVVSSEEGASRLAAEVKTSSDAVLVWSRTFFSAWQATVDGAPVKPLRADGHLVGVPVSAGRHRVEISWRPWPVWMGLGLALGGCLTVLALRRA